MILRIDHVSIAVKDHSGADEFFSDLLGLVKGGAGSDDNSGFFYQIYSAGDLSRFELISPTRKGSFLENFLKSRDGGIHHITFQVDDIKNVRLNLEKKGIPYFGYSDKYDNWKELYIHPKDAFGVLIQLAEFSPADWIDDSINIRGKKKWRIDKKDDYTKISFAHPGGGKVDIELSANDIEELIKDLKK
ncbi:MAG TPA: VOC family protein [Spirochaetota bacterium]|nr:VOC family protein [Spirochaetota bacterium]HPJ42353.1 VOC family protein [Spirochaetota bacterium]